MSGYVDFHYMPLEGKITGKQVLKQTEDAINDLGEHVYELDIDENRIDEAIEKSEQAIETADAALSAVTTDRSVWKNTVAEMKATDIDLGVTAATRGEMVFNDGNGAFYGVRSEKSGDVDGDDTVFLDNGNVAERIQSMNIIAKGNNIIFVANVAELVNSDALIGNVYGTTGYYAANDGGAGLYSIRAKTQSDVEDGGSIIFLGNGDVAELITNGTINVKQFGAYGDGTHDDSDAIQDAIDTGLDVYFPVGSYATTKKITISNIGNTLSTYNFDASNAEILYSGNDYAFLLTRLWNATLRFGSISSANGGNIEMYSTGNYDYIQYLNIYFEMLSAKTGYANVHGHISDEMHGSMYGWINEVNWFGGRFFGNASYNFLVETGCNCWKYYNVGFEGGDTCIYFDATDGGISQHTMFYCRHAESFNNIIVAVGEVSNVYSYHSRKFDYYKVTVNPNCNDWRVISDKDFGSRLVNGVWHFEEVSKSLQGGVNLNTGADFNDLVYAGDYYATTNLVVTSLVNAPVKAIGILTVQRYDNFYNRTASAVIQTYATQTGEAFIRTSSDGITWGVWHKNENIASTQFATNTDLNTCGVGSYYCSTYNLMVSLLNRPSSVGSIFRMDVDYLAMESDKRVRQVITDTSGNMFVRVGVIDGSFTTWKQITMV